MSWLLEIDGPIELPKGKNLVTLRDAALYITKLPKARTQRERMAGRDAVALLLVAEQDAPTMFARIGVMRALHRLQPKVARAKAYRIVR